MIFSQALLVFWRLWPHLLSEDYAWHFSGPRVYTCYSKSSHRKVSLLFIHWYKQLTIWSMNSSSRLRVKSQYYYIHLALKSFQFFPVAAFSVGSWTPWHTLSLCVYLCMHGRSAPMCLCLFWWILHFLTPRCSLFILCNPWSGDQAFLPRSLPLLLREWD